MLSHGMKQQGGVSLSHLFSLIAAFLNPWIVAGVILLIAFFALYTASLSWADLSYVLPATSLGYVMLALVAKFALHEEITTWRWLGIALIVGGVGFVAGGPTKTVDLERGGELCDGVGGDADQAPHSAAAGGKR
jgi:drug/metabolite transporter (DMT)-like permease